MKHLTKLSLACLIGALLAFGAMGKGSAPSVLKARATIAGAPGSGISGEAFFIQTGDGILPTVKVIVHVRGLQPGTKHGIHIHEVGNCTPFSAAGGHFDPGPFGQSNPDANHPFHMGDLPNLEANSSGVAVIIHQTSRITLSPGPLSIFDSNGSAIIVHENEDLGTTGVPGGAGGGRIACGIIQPD